MKRILEFVILFIFLFTNTIFAAPEKAVSSKRTFKLQSEKKSQFLELEEKNLNIERREILNMDQEPFLELTGSFVKSHTGFRNNNSIYKIRVVIKNNGTKNTSSFQVNITGFDPWNQSAKSKNRWRSFKAKAIPVGKTFTKDLEFDATDPEFYRVHKFLMTIDADNIVHEKDEDNNFVYHIVRDATGNKKYGDFLPDVIEKPIKSNNTYSLRVIFKNIGMGDLSRHQQKEGRVETNMKMYDAQGNVIYDKDAMTGPTNYSWAPGYTYSVNHIGISADIINNAKKVVAQVDTKNVYTEANENNNSKERILH